MNFTAKQREAVEVENGERDICIVAVPGSGKTTVLVEFYRRLVVEKGVLPERILAITFTEKAARHMKDKLAESFRDQPDLRRALEQAHVSTIHGFCTRLLRQNSIAAGLAPDFQVLDARRAVLLGLKTANDALDQMSTTHPDAMARLIRSLASPDLAGDIPDLYDAMRAADITPNDLRGLALDDGVPLAEVRDAIRQVGTEKTFGWKPTQIGRLHEVLEAAHRVAQLPDSPATAEHFRAIDEFPTNLKGIKQGSDSHARLMAVKDNLLPRAYRALLTQHFSGDRETLIQVMERFDRLYSERKRAMEVLDFADLQAFSVQLLQMETGVRQRVQSEFQYVLMDEFQDTNRLEAKLVRLLRGSNGFYAVGDINQSIYGFRHADPSVFRDYRDGVRERGERLVELEENWRSRPEILSAVETVSHRMPGIEALPLIAKREFPLKTEASVEVLAAIGRDQDSALELEARLVARRILDFDGSLQLSGGLAQFGDIAVLLRNSEVVPAFTRAFEEAGIPYLLSQSKGFFETREIADLLCLLQVLDNPRDEISVAAVLRSPFAGVSDEALLRMKNGGNLGNALRKRDHLDESFHADDLSKLRCFREQFLRWRESRDTAGFDRLLMRAMDETGYGFDPGTRPAANIEKFLALARDASSRLTLRQFVEDLKLMRKADAREPDAPPEDAVNAVRIMTVHAAKGLEFPIVFLAALHKGIASGCGSPAFSPQFGLGAKWLNPITGKEKRDSFLKAIEEEVTEREAEEGNRLFYVAMTRAEEHLVFSYSRFGKAKEWASVLETALSLDLETPQERVQRLEAPDGEAFAIRILAANSPPPPAVRRDQEFAPAVVPLLDRPAIGEQHDFAASVTSVALFGHCPRRYFLERYLGFEGNVPRRLESDEDAPGAEIDASQFGLEVHAMLAGQTVAQPAPEAKRLVEAFHASDLGLRAARAARVSREFDFLMELEGVVLRGQIDLWFEEGGELVLLDYKTDEIKPREAPGRATRYAPQLRLYALALERLLGRSPTSAFVYFLRPGVAVPVSLEPSLIDGPETLVREFREAQASLNFPLHEGDQCARCPYVRGLCPARPAESQAAGMPVTEEDYISVEEPGAG